VTHLRTVRRTARKAHKALCFACRLPVVPGDEYGDSSFADGGRMRSTVEHTVCRREAVALLDPWMLRDGYEEGVLVDGSFDDDEMSPEWTMWRDIRINDARRKATP